MTDEYGRNIHYLRLSVTERCNLRCRYCMPEKGICKKSHGEMLTEDEMIMAVEAAASLGFDKLRITGGEPLVKKNIVSICSRAASVKGIKEVCLTTNGTLLPQFANPLREAGVNRLNISLDTLDAAKYAHITRWGTLEQALSGIHCAIEAGFERIKINTVLIGGFNENEIRSLAELTMQNPIDVRFIELMPMYDSGEFDQNAMIPCETVLKHLPELEPAAVGSGSWETCSEEGEGLRDAQSVKVGLSETYEGVARLYHLPGAKGNVGLISPVSSHFCASCNRLRLTADGHLKPCLHSPAEYRIKGLGFDGMVDQFKKAISEKPLCHDELTAEKRSAAGRDMNRIGG